MTDVFDGPNGLEAVVHETEPSARIFMFINGQYTHWVEFDVLQMDRLIKLFQKRLKEMKRREQ